MESERQEDDDRPVPDDDDGDDASSSWEPIPGSPRIPDSDPEDQQKKRYAVAVDRLPEAALTVTVEDGSVASSYAPAGLVAELTERVQALLRDVGGGFRPMFYGALATNSMTLFFGDPRPEEPQAQLPVEVTHSHAIRIAELIDSETAELYARAVTMGEPSKRYADLAHFVESEGIALHWKPRGEPSRVLTAQRAAQHYARLSEEPPHDERPLQINGVLYRVIADRQDQRLGSVGIRLHHWSARPPKRHGHARRSVIADYRDERVEEAIKAGLIGEPVQAVLLIRQPVFGLSIDPEHVELVLVDIARGPSEDSRLGPRIVENDDPDDDLPF